MEKLRREVGRKLGEGWGYHRHNGSSRMVFIHQDTQKTVSVPISDRNHERVIRLAKIAARRALGGYYEKLQT